LAKDKRKYIAVTSEAFKSLIEEGLFFLLDYIYFYKAKTLNKDY